MKSRAYVTGWDAYYAKYAMASCPYMYGTKDYDDWHDGYYDADEHDHLEEYVH